MKKVLITLVLIAATTVVGFAQKLGHINSTELLEMMPGRDSIEQKIEMNAQQMEQALADMKAEYDKKVAEFQEQSANWSESVTQSKYNSIMSLEREMQQFNVNANKELQKTEQKLIQPLIEQAQAAIDKVAEDNGFTYIFDTSTGAIVYAKGENIMPMVKAELGIQ
ncbi:OmpH/Skp family outer membrane protein [Halocola ammonii]